MPRSAFWVLGSALTFSLTTACGSDGNPVTPPPPPATCQDVNAKNYGGAPPCQYAPPPPARCQDVNATNYGGELPCTYPPPPPTPPVSNLVANPGRIFLGQTVALTFSCNNGTTATASWKNTPIAMNGNEVVTPTATGEIEFIFTCTGAGGTAVSKDTALVEPVPPIGTRVTVNRPDERSGLKHKYVYMTALGGVDRGLDTNSVLRNTILAGNNWMVEQTGWAPWVDEWAGEPDIIHVQSSLTDFAMTSNGAWTSVRQQLTTKGLNDPNTTYVVFVEISSLNGCGEGGVKLAFLYLQTQGCNNVLHFATSPTGPSGTWAKLALHEMFHSAGAVSPGAPDYDSARGGLHVATVCDLMYYTLCESPTIDATGRNYFGDNVPVGVVNIKNDPYFKFVRPPNPRP